jgi:dihydroorotate dehydrogenase electron transfer subunit
MIQYYATIKAIENISSDIWMITFRLPENYPEVRAGQFVNVRINDSLTPLLRRPFSFYSQLPSHGRILFRVVGEGTILLSQKKMGESLDILGPLGNSYCVDDEYDTAILVAGGLGVAPMPILTEQIKKTGKRIVTFLGGRTKGNIISQYLENVIVATDDGSIGERGTIVDVLRKCLSNNGYSRPKIFTCGPTSMINSIYKLIKEFDIACEVSLEGTMACGFGICQGCPVEVCDSEKKYKLICKDGPVFDLHSLRVPING